MLVRTVDMRIALLYPPPWKLPNPGEAQDFGRDGAPDGYRQGDLDGDFYQTPYGMLSIAAQAVRAGHKVKLLNLSAHPWETVQKVVRQLDADLWGMSCWTANRRGVALAADEIKKHHPDSHVVVGGPHAAPLAKEMLRHHAAIDTVTSGESEQTFIELADRLADGRGNVGLAGAHYREGGGIVAGPDRASASDLDVYASVHEFFCTHIFMTSRGCPWACTFCGAESQWGRGFRGNSVGYVLDALERALERLPVKMLMIKDDTFTTNRKRVLEICRGIRERGLRFMWSCDTRVDLLSDELLREMRLAGCERLSLGVESGAPDIIANVDKKITVDDILESTALAKKYGIRVRYYMMLGNRGETTETFQQTLDFLNRAKPHEYIFSCLSIYPGTRDFADAERAGWLDRSVFFRESFQELKVPFDAGEEVTAMMNAWFAQHGGVQRVYQEGVSERLAIVERLPEHHAAHLDLGGAYFADGEFDLAERHVRKALDLGYPLPGLALNYLACIAVERGDFDAMMDLYSEAAKRDPQHYVLIKNVDAARSWFRDRGSERGLQLSLDANHDWKLLERTAQPTLPGPLADDFADWSKDNFAGPAAEPSIARAGSLAQLKSRKHLDVV